MTAVMDLSFPGQRTATATSCIPHDSVYMPGPRVGKSENSFFVVILDSKYSKMTPKFVKQKSHWLHSSIKFANPEWLTSNEFSPHRSNSSSSELVMRSNQMITQEKMLWSLIKLNQDGQKVLKQMAELLHSFFTFFKGSRGNISRL